MANQILAGAVVQAGMVIAGVDADNPPYVGPPQPQSWNFDNEHNHSTYVLVDAHSGMKLSVTSGWTLEFWAKFDGNPGQENIIEWSDGDHISITSWEGGNEWKFNTNTNQNMTISFDNVDGNFPSLWTSGSAGEWSHVAFVGTVLGNGSVQINFYLNGVKHPQSYTTSQTYGVAGNTQIGMHLDGSMFDFRMSSTPRYTADFTAPTALLPVDANVTLSTLRYEILSDESTYGSSVSVVGYSGAEPVPQEDLPISSSSESSSSGSTSVTSPVAEGTWTVATTAQFGDNFNGQAFIMREGGNNTILSTPATGNMVGSSIAISDNYVFVGNSHYDAYGDNAGAVFVYDKTTGAMVRTLTGPGTTDNSGFGSVDMTVVSGGVDRVAVRTNKRAQIVGSPNESYGYGHIQIMDFDGGNVVEIHNPDFDVNQGYVNMMGFGLSTGWTPTKFVSAINQTDVAGMTDAGAVIIYNHDGTISTRLDGQNANDRFGRDISTQSDHERVLVGVSGWNNKAGKVQLFETDGTEVFSIERPTTEAGAHGSAQPEFGKIVAYGSGRIAVGENLDTSVGRVHIFDETDGSYINTISHPRNDNPATSDLEIVGNYIFVSASGVNSNNGAFWVYDLDGNNGTRIDNIGSSGFARFGHYLAASVG